MGQKLSTSGLDNLPTVDITNKTNDNKDGQEFIGKLVAHRQTASIKMRMARPRNMIFMSLTWNNPRWLFNRKWAKNTLV